MYNKEKTLLNIKNYVRCLDCEDSDLSINLTSSPFS